MVAIAETEPHYIRCVKPNEEQLPMSFEVFVGVPGVGGFVGIDGLGIINSSICIVFLRLVS